MIYASVAHLAETATHHSGAAAELAAVMGRVGSDPHFTACRGARYRVRVTDERGTRTNWHLSELARRLRDGVEPRPVGAFVACRQGLYGECWRPGLGAGCTVRNIETGETMHVVDMLYLDREANRYNSAEPEGLVSHVTIDGWRRGGTHHRLDAMWEVTS